MACLELSHSWHLGPYGKRRRPGKVDGTGAKDVLPMEILRFDNLPT